MRLVWWRGLCKGWKKKRADVNHPCDSNPTPRVIGEVETCREYLIADAFPPEYQDTLHRWWLLQLGVFFLLPQVPLSPGWGVRDAGGMVGAGGGGPYEPVDMVSASAHWVTRGF